MTEQTAVIRRTAGLMRLPNKTCRDKRIGMDQRGRPIEICPEGRAKSNARSVHSARCRRRDL